jgi:anhydro-N-acetylmuramic acid kinase
MNRWIIGVAPGTSLYGVSAALVEVQGAGLDLRVRLVQGLHHPYPRDLRHLLLRLTSAASIDLKHVSMLHRVLGETFAIAARRVADQGSFALPQVLCVGCPGHLLCHDPDGRYPSLCEAGMASIVAERTGLTTVSDFRSRDLAAGGLGGSVEALADFMMFRHARETRILLHLGGTASVVFLPAQCLPVDVLAFEAAPGNLLFDNLVRRLTGNRQMSDAGGKAAVQGRCIDSLLESWLEHPYWQRRPPKSLPAGAFGDAFAEQVAQLARQRSWDRNDVLCTATHLAARTIAAALHRWCADCEAPHRVLLSGRGIRNGFLWHLLEQRLPGTPLARTDYAGVPPEYRRALNSAILAALALDGVPANLPSATGASGGRLLGSFTPGTSSNWSRCLAWMANQSAVGHRLAG